MLVIGTSAVVQPAGLMPLIAKQAGARIIEINPERTPLTDSNSDYIIMEKAGEALNKIVSELDRQISGSLNPETGKSYWR
jgi:NAD-dependent deacetylase